MALDFPSNPTVGQEYIYGSKVWTWTGSVWNSWNTADFPVLSSSDNWDSTYTTVSSNSATWVGGGGSYDDSLLQATSGYWDSTYTTVSSNSASWVGGVSYDDSLLQSTSGSWDSTYTTVSSNSATWSVDTIYDDSLLQSTSGSWDSTYTTVSSNSATWGAGGDPYDDSLLQSTSGNWDSTYTTVGANSASWIGGGVGPTIDTTVYIDAAAMAAEDGGASSSTITDGGTNNVVDWWNMAIGEKLFAKIAMPPQWDHGNVDVDVFWTVQGDAPTGEEVRWSVASEAAGNDAPWDTSFTTRVSSSDDVVIANGDIHTIAIPSVTPGGSPTDGDLLFFELQRIGVADGVDLPEDARFLGMRVHYQNTAARSWYITKLGNEADDASGAGEKTAWIAPGNGYIHSIHSGSSLSAANAGLTVDVLKNGTSVLATSGVIAVGTDSTLTSPSTAHTLTTSPTTFVQGDRISFEIAEFGGTGAKGLHTDLLISWD